MRTVFLWLMFAGLGVAMSLAFAGSIFDTAVRPEYRRVMVNVTWLETDEIKTVCGPRALACALPGDPCVIWTYPDPAHDTLGHELLHCFLGRYHPHKDQP